MPLTPNPYSPYATAAADARHVFFGFLGADPLPNVLGVTACDALAVVPAEPLTLTDPANPSVGLCPECVAAMSGRTLRVRRPRGEVTDCRFCEAATSHGGVCALCRQELHDEWWPIRPASDTVPEGTVPTRIARPRPGEIEAGQRLPDGARLVDDTTVFANPFTVEWSIDTGLAADEDDARTYVVNVFEEWLTAPYADTEWPRLAEQRAKVLALLPSLKGRPLACSCDLGKPCCGDVLLRLANP
ncbi:DUF4326 domain-containing protein (plasmid) [Streptosporangium sandarakinum]|uniref:DUF4326 domain-containing protein n=1 Tax=Streptosporangium sandarakinum TaxID=1260955 RepID=UPI003D9328D5